MEIGRRKLLVGAVGLSLARLSPTFGTATPAEEEPISSGRGLHPLTRSLLDRAGRAGARLDQFLVERAIREIAELRPKQPPLAIKWLDTPARAFEHLCLYGLDELVRMRSARFWRGTPSSIGIGKNDPDERLFDLYGHATDVLRVEEHDRALMEPKLTAKRRSDEIPGGTFRARTIAARIGWLETSLPAAAAEAVCAVEDLLAAGHTECSKGIYHQLMVFEACENGLLATWETGDELVCVPASTVVVREMNATPAPCESSENGWSSTVGAGGGDCWLSKRSIIISQSAGVSPCSRLFVVPVLVALPFTALSGYRADQIRSRNRG